jgi:hypothetical protein
MSKSDFDLQLKNDAVENRFTVDGDYIVFDKKSNLSYQILTNFTLNDLLTANPLSKTRLNKGLLLSLDTLSKTIEAPIKIRASYHSPEYHLTSFGCCDSELYTTGNALALGVAPDKVEALITAVSGETQIGEYGAYSWGVHIGYTKDQKNWDTRSDTSTTQIIKNFISDDKMKNILFIGGAVAAVWFFFIKK